MSNEDAQTWSLEEEVMNSDVMLGLNNNSDPSIFCKLRNSSAYSVDNPEAMEDNFQYDAYDSSGQQSDDESRDAATLTDRSYKLLTFKNGTDVSGIPIQKDGMAVCEKCGAIGVKHAFYSKSKRFCSLACSRSYAILQREGKPIPKPQPIFKFPLEKVKIFKKDIANKAEYNSKHILNEVNERGYKALMRFEGFGHDSSEDFWLNVCNQNVHPVGWCASQGKPLIPPKSIQHKHLDWKEFLVKRLTGARTLPADFHDKVSESLTSRFRVGIQLEVVDKNRISQTRIARVEEVIGGRLHVRYEDEEYQDEGFWCHERSPLIHPISWSHYVGHGMAETPAPKQQPQKGTSKRSNEKDVATWDMFPSVKNNNTNLKFKEGMKLEAIDPLNLATVCVATVTKVMKHSYLMIGIDGYNSSSGSDWLCHHASSNCIFPAGFCSLNDIELTPPRGHRGEFKWFDYLKATKSIAAPVGLFNRELPNHGFKVGMHLEAVDLMEPRLICVGTVTKVIGRLLRVHFDGWDTTYDQWCDCESPDLYPTGWCQVVGYPLEPPKNYESSMDKKRKAKAQQYRGPRKKKRSRLMNFLKGKGHGKRGSSCQSEDEKSMTCEVQDSPSEDENKRMAIYDYIDDSVTDKEANTSTESDVLAADGRQEMQNDPNGTPSTKTIPRLIDANCRGVSMTSHQSVITPELWSVFDVSQFLRINDCGAHCESFTKKKIDGRKFVTLTKEQIVNLTGMKVGPSLKIFDLIQQLKAKVHVT